MSLLALFQLDVSEECPLTYASTTPIVNVSSSVSSLITGTYTLKRTHARTPSKLGRMPPPAYTTYEIPAGIYPATAQQTRDPDGNFSKLVIAIYTLAVLEPDGVCEADQVLFDGTWYQIDNVKNWSSSGGFFEAIAVAA